MSVNRVNDRLWKALVYEGPIVEFPEGVGRGTADYNSRSQFTHRMVIIMLTGIEPEG